MNAVTLTRSQESFLRLRKEILAGDLEPGNRITLRPTAKRLGVSMNTVGEALRSLENEGLVEFEPRIGARVKARNLADVRADFVLRLALECEAARQCAIRAEAGSLRVLEGLAENVDELAVKGEDLEAARCADQDFHLAVARFSEAPTLELALSPLLPRIIVLDQVVEHSSASSHVLLVKAMREGETQAVEAMREHVLDAQQWAIGAGFEPG